MDKKEVRVRFAPSPTGHLHIGSLRTAIFNLLYARHTGGKYLLRIEDTDRLRSTKEFEASQLKSLQWFDLMPDEPLIHQIDRLDDHKKIALELMEKGLAYPCFCEPIPRCAELTRDDRDCLDFDGVAKDIEESSGVGHKYPGTCRDKKWSEQDLQKPHAIRIKIPKDLKTISFDDLIRGNITIEADQLDDFVIVRRDGTPIYNFSVVLDDIFMKITHVIRGEDHISNTPKQIIIYNALQQEKPFFAHLPLILGSAGNKLSKRDAAVSVEEYRAQGFLVPALFNYLVRLGWSYGDQEIFSRDELIKLFTIEDVGKKGAIFDIEKLKWLNALYLRNLDYDSLLKAIDDIGGDYREKIIQLWNEEQLKKLFLGYAQRAQTVLELVENIINFAFPPKELNLDLISKWISDKTVDLLNSFIEKLTHNNNKLNHEELLLLAKEVCKEFDVKLVNLAQPVRLALTGTICSPGVFELIEILGCDETIKRINFLISKLGK
ncbi:MAG: glutamate--tRNA ligase [bacterium]